METKMSRCGWVFLILFSSVVPTASAASGCCGVVWTQTAANGTAFNHPRGIAVIQNELFVADPDNNQVDVFGLDGSFHRTLAMPSPGRPLDLAADKEGNLYVALDSGQAVLKLNPLSGAEVSPPMTDGVYYRGIGVDPDTQTVFAASGVDAQIHWFKLVAGSYVAQTPFGSPVPFNGGVTIPTGMVKVGSNLFVCNTAGNSVVQFTGDDSSGYAYVGQVTATSGQASVTSPYEIAVDSSGRFFVPSYGSAQYTIFNPDWTFHSTCQNFAYGPSTYGIAVDADDDVFLSTDMSPEQVVRTNPCLGYTYSGSNPPDAGDCFLYPSPARGDRAAVSYNMAESGTIDLGIWNEKAERVAHVADTKLEGTRITDFSIAGFASGVYFYVLTLTYDSGRVEKIGPKKFVVLH